jgi:hypothetical protein
VDEKPLTASAFVKKNLIFVEKCDILFRHRCGGFNLPLGSATTPF